MNFSFNRNNGMKKDENTPLVGNIEPPVQDEQPLQYNSTNTNVNDNVQNVDSSAYVDNTHVDNTQVNNAHTENGNADSVNSTQVDENGQNANQQNDANVQNGESVANATSVPVENQNVAPKNTNDAPNLPEQPIILETKEEIEYRETMEKIEHTNLSPNASVEDILALCRDAIAYNFNSICIHPVYLKTAYKFLKKNGKLLDVKLATVVGCPLGENLLKSKLTELKHVFKAKADIVDVYLNISAIKYLNRKDKAIKKQIKKFAKFTKIVKEKNRDRKKDRIVRIVLDTRYFNLQEMQHICQYCIHYNIPYITITEGITSTKLNFEEVQSLVTSLNGQMQVKLNYNIKNVAEFNNTALKDISLFATKNGIDIANELKVKLNLQ